MFRKSVQRNSAKPLVQQQSPKSFLDKPSLSSVAKFIVPYWGIQSTMAWGRRTGPPSLCSMTGRYGNPMPQSTLNPRQRLRIGPLSMCMGPYAGLESPITSPYVYSNTCTCTKCSPIPKSTLSPQSGTQDLASGAKYRITGHIKKRKVQNSSPKLSRRW